ncbi:MAG: GerAB/ArcD/ProY family transporter [Bacillota bacterium]
MTGRPRAATEAAREVGRRRPQISVTEGIALGTCLGWPTAILYLPSVLAARGREDAWLGALVGGVVILPVGLLLAALAGRLPRLGLVDQAQTALGRWPGKAVGAAFVLGVGLLAAYAVRAGTDMVRLLMLPHTPPWVVAGVIVVQGAVGAYFGLEVVARAAVIAFLSVGVVLVVLIPGFAPMFDARRLLPVLAQGPGPLFESAALGAGFWGQVVLLALIAHAFYGPRHLRAATVGAGVTTVLVGWLLFALAQAAAGWYGVSRFTLSAIEVIRSVRILLPLLERVDVLVVIGWTAMGFVQVAWLLWGCASGAARVLGLVDSRPLIPLWASVVYGFALVLPEDLTVLTQVWTQVVVPAVTGGLVVLVAIVWAVSALRRLESARTGG